MFAPKPAAAACTTRCASRMIGTFTRPVAAGCPTRQLRRPAIEEKREQSKTETSAAPERQADVGMTDEQLQKLAALRREAKAGSPQTSNLLLGALEEAQLISWPSPGKAVLDTVLVLAIVSGTGVLLFGLNVLLADGSQWWYKGH